MSISVLNNSYINGTSWSFLINKVLLTFNVCRQTAMCELRMSNKHVGMLLLSHKNLAKLKFKN